MHLSDEIEHFIRVYAKELEEQNAAIFAGAGLSVGAGFVNWAELLRSTAIELGLDVDLEYDLVSLAQYHVNEAGGNRAKLNRILIEEFSKSTAVSENHRLLARLPISVFWTTNYDDLIEAALREVGKKPDVKHQVKQLQITKPGRDAVVYKMHGDVDHPSDAVLTKDDYEKFHHERQLFLTALSGDLVSKTFLFLGLSFKDPNLDYILSRVRVWLGNNAREHFAIFRRINELDYEDSEEYEYDLRRQELFTNDLRRFGINPLLIEDYSDISEILSRIEALYRSKSILVSGSAHEYGRWGRVEAEGLIHHLSGELVKSGYRVVSGFGLGVGSAVISGALERIYSDSETTVADHLVLRPFPQNVDDEQKRAELYTRYRDEMVSLAGCAVFVFGNRLENGEVVEAAGVFEEFAMARSNGVCVIPIGATGYAAKSIWEQVKESLESYFPNAEGVRKHFDVLGNDDSTEEEIIESVIAILDEIRK